MVAFDIWLILPYNETINKSFQIGKATMKAAKLFFVFGLIMSLMPVPLQGMDKDMTDQEFDKFFTQPSFHDLSSCKHKFNQRSVKGVGVARSSPLCYPLEYALHIWLARIKTPAQRTVEYTDELVFGWISRLLENGAPSKYQDFNPLVHLLYQYDQGNITPNLLGQLVNLLCRHGAEIDNKERDKWTVFNIGIACRYASAQNTQISPLEAYINSNPTVSAQDILDNVAQSKILKADEIRQLFAKNNDESVRVDSIEVTNWDNPWVSEPARKPRLFSMQQLIGVATLSFVCGIGVKCLYDWYCNADAQDEMAEEDTPAVV